MQERRCVVHGEAGHHRPVQPAQADPAPIVAQDQGERTGVERIGGHPHHDDGQEPPAHGADVLGDDGGAHLVDEHCEDTQAQQEERVPETSHQDSLCEGRPIMPTRRHDEQRQPRHGGRG